MRGPGVKPRMRLANIVRRGSNRCDDSQETPRTPRPGIFRPAFLQEYRQRSRTGDVVRIMPRWLGPAYWLVVWVALMLLGSSFVLRAHEYAAGPAIVRYSDRTDLTAITGGTVVDVAVRAEQWVVPGQILVRFHSGQESAELDGIEREFQLELVNLLRDPSDQAARQSMARLRAERDRTIARLDEKVLRAPIAGRVSDVRIRAGQHLESGDPVLTIVGPAPKLTVIAVVPGRYRPLLKPGLPLRLQLSGFPYAHQDLTIAAIGDEVVGPMAIRRHLGADIGDAVPRSGPAVLVSAALRGSSFRWEGRERSYYDGMQGRAQVSVRDQSLLMALVPGLRTLLERSDD